MKFGPPFLVAAAALAIAAAPLRAQQTPTPTSAPSDPCPAVRSYGIDVSTIPGADAAEWEIRRQPPGAAGDPTTAPLVAADTVAGTQASVDLDLRSLGSVLDGTLYHFRARALSGATPAAEWSEAVVFDQAVSPDGMFRAVALPGPGIRVSWTLVGDLAACTERVRYLVWEGDPGGPPDYSNPFTADTSEVEVAVASRTRHVVTLRLRGAGSSIGVQATPLVVVFSNELLVTVFDSSEASCTGRDEVREGALVRLLRGDQVAAEEVAGSSGRVRLSVPRGSYTLEASSGPCAPATLAIEVTGDTVAEIRLTGCHAEEADLAVSFREAGRPPAVPPYPVAVDVRNLGPGAPAMPATLVVQRRGPEGFVDLAYEEVTGLCDARAFTFQDEDFEPGTSYRYTARLEVEDASAANNRTAKAVTFPVQLVAVEPVPPGPQPVRLDAFRIHGGAANVISGTTVTLDAETAGAPDRFRVAGTTTGCEGAFEGAEWAPYDPDQPPTLPLQSVGVETVRLCFQVARSDGGAAQESEVLEDAVRVVPPEWTSPLIGVGFVVPFGPIVPPQAIGCVDATFAVGIAVYAAQLIDAIGLRCATLGPGGEHGAVETTSLQGGSGGEPAELTCPSGQVLQGFRGRTGLSVDQVSIACAPWSASEGAQGAPTWLGPVGGSGGWPTPEIFCPGPLPVRYLNVVAGRVVAGFRFACEAPAEWGE